MKFDKGKAKKIFFLTLLTSCVPGAFLFFAWYLGFFNTVVIKEVQSPNMLGIVLAHQGNYQKVGKKIIDVQNYLAPTGIGCKPMIIYYDDEAKVIKNNLKSAGGCLVQNLPKNLPPKYQVIQFKRTESLLGKVSSHPGIAKIQLFSAMRKYARKRSISLKFPSVAIFEDQVCFLYFLKFIHKP